MQCRPIPTTIFTLLPKALQTKIPLVLTICCFCLSVNCLNHLPAQSFQFFQWSCFSFIYPDLLWFCFVLPTLDFFPYVAQSRRFLEAKFISPFFRMQHWQMGGAVSMGILSIRFTGSNPQNKHITKYHCEKIWPKVQNHWKPIKQPTKTKCFLALSLLVSSLWTALMLTWDHHVVVTLPPKYH